MRELHSIEVSGLAIRFGDGSRWLVRRAIQQAFGHRRTSYRNRAVGRRGASAYIARTSRLARWNGAFSVKLF